MLLAFIFDSAGAGEWLVLLAVLLVVIGPKNLPSTLRKVGNYYAKFRRAADNFKRQLMDMDREFERSFNEPPPGAFYSEPEPEMRSEPAGETAGAQPNASTPSETESVQPQDSAASDDTGVDQLAENGVAPVKERVEENADGDRPDQQA